MNLERFKDAQAADDSGLEAALAELRVGQKRTHWIWYIFPQLTGLGRSETARFYALEGVDEAYAFLRDPELRGNFRTSLEVVAMRLDAGVMLNELMGGTIDAQKLVSSLTLFQHVAATLHDDTGALVYGAIARLSGTILEIAERQGYGRCQFTETELGVSHQGESTEMI